MTRVSSALPPDLTMTRWEAEKILILTAFLWPVSESERILK